MNEDDRAEPLYVKSIKIAETRLGKNHPSYANKLNNLAALYIAMDVYAEAEPYAGRHLKLLKTTGEFHLNMPGCK